MPVSSVNNDGVRCAKSCELGVSTIATLIEPPRFDRLPSSPPPQQPQGRAFDREQTRDHGAPHGPSHGFPPWRSTTCEAWICRVVWVEERV
jgi:hypothetical protein